MRRKMNRIADYMIFLAFVGLCATAIAYMVIDTLTPVQQKLVVIHNLDGTEKTLVVDECNTRRTSGLLFGDEADSMFVTCYSQGEVVLKGRVRYIEYSHEIEK